MIKDYSSATDFANDFDLVENALDQRSLYRWNGREIRNKENLSEHTHLVLASAIKLYDEFKKNWYLASVMKFEQIIRLAILHDSLELLRGDILSVTKDVIPGLRDWVDVEEKLFVNTVTGINFDDVTEEIVTMADMMACYKFLERELCYDHGKFIKKAYICTKKKYDEYYQDFCKRYGIKQKAVQQDSHFRWSKGYEADAGVDVILTDDVLFMPLSTNKIDLKVVVTPDEGTMSFLCSRTSAANKGLVVAMCPIDPNFNGTITAIVHNVSDDVIIYEKGESFCQLVTVPLTNSNIDEDTLYTKNYGKRGYGKLGSTGK